jgi:hypothetical protein
MEAAREQLYDVVGHISPRHVATLLEFALYLRQKDSDDFSDLLQASESSLAFWDNPIDDEVWNNAL